MSNSASIIVWFRRDLRLGDHRAIERARALHPDGSLLGLFVADHRLLAASGWARREFLIQSLDAFNNSLGGRLVIRSGEPAWVLLQLCQQSGSSRVVATADFSPYGRARDAQVESTLATHRITMEFVDSPYVVTPGVVRSSSGRPFQVFTAFRRAWESIADVSAHQRSAVQWLEMPSEPSAVLREIEPSPLPSYFPERLLEIRPSLPRAGEDAANSALDDFAANVESYGELRDRPDRNATSRLSPYLRFGTVHPRQVLSATRGSSIGARTFESEIVWREFYADVLFHHPHSARESLQPSMRNLRVDTDDRAIDRFAAWCAGETGVELVDAGMRQLLTEGWMHNRVRMVAASFLVKHLHLDWRWGARWFMNRLVDGDLASNSHGWQWTAGTGTDAAPFHRVFNPELQAQRFDPDGIYRERYLSNALTQSRQPALFGRTVTNPIVDLATERAEALARFADVRSARVR